MKVYRDVYSGAPCAVKLTGDQCVSSYPRMCFCPRLVCVVVIYSQSTLMVNCCHEVQYINIDGKQWSC